MKIVINRADGGVSIMTLIDGADAASCLDKWKAQHPGEYVSSTEVSDDAIPQDRSFRNAWTGIASGTAQIDLNIAKSCHLSAVNAECDKRMAALVSDYPENEQKTFVKQEDEARAYIADNTASTPMLDALSLNRGIDKATLASKIIDKANALCTATGNFMGYRQKLEDQINAALTLTDLQAIDPTSGWPS